MTINLNKIRIMRLNPATDKIISGFKERSLFQQNLAVFTEEFCDGKSRIGDRLFWDQWVDCRHGRFEFPDQNPLGFTKEELCKPIKPRMVMPSDVRPVKIDIADKTLNLYKKTVTLICHKGEQREFHGEISKLDVRIMLDYNERANGIAKEVAESKIQKDSSILELKGDELRAALTYKKREDEVIADFVDAAYRFKLIDPKNENSLATEEIVKGIARDVIDTTVDSQMVYVAQVKLL